MSCIFKKKTKKKPNTSKEDMTQSGSEVCSIQDSHKVTFENSIFIPSILFQNKFYLSETYARYNT